MTKIRRYKIINNLKYKKMYVVFIFRFEHEVCDLLSMCVIIIDTVVCMLWLRFTGVCRCYGNIIYCHLRCSGAGGCGLTDVNMLKNVSERAPP